MEERETQVLRLVPQEKDKDHIIGEIERFLERAKAGEVKSFLLYEESDKEFKWTRCRMNCSDAFMGCSRMAYKLNQEWDNLK